MAYAETLFHIATIETKSPNEQNVNWTLLMNIGQITAVLIADYECRVFILPSVSECRQCINPTLYYHVQVLDI